MNLWVLLVSEQTQGQEIADNEVATKFCILVVKGVM